MIKTIKKIVVIAIFFVSQCLSPAIQDADRIPGPEALHQAASLLDEVRVRELINEYQFPIDQPDSDGWLPIHHAVYPDLQNLSNMSADEQIRQLSIINLLRSTLTHTTSIGGRSVMHLVARSGNVYLAHVLYQYNNQLITMRDNRGNTPLHHAASFNQTPFMYYLIHIQHMPVDVMNGFDRTPLQCAIETGSQEAIIFLISCNASIYIPDYAGLTPLDYAEMYDPQHPQLNAADSMTSLLIREYMVHHDNDLVPAVLTTMGLGLQHMQTACSILLYCMMSHLGMTQLRSKL